MVLKNWLASSFLSSTREGRCKNTSYKKWRKGSQDQSGRPVFRDWYDMKAPAMFSMRNIGTTLTTRTQGTKTASDGLQSCATELSLADLQNAEAALKKIQNNY